MTKIFNIKVILIIDLIIIIVLALRPDLVLGGF